MLYFHTLGRVKFIRKNKKQKNCQNKKGRDAPVLIVCGSSKGKKSKIRTSQISHLSLPSPYLLSGFPRHADVEEQHSAAQKAEDQEDRESDTPADR